jgi:chitinase
MRSIGRIALIAALASLFLYCGAALQAQEGTAPTFHYTSGQKSVTLAGRDPAQGGTTVIPTLLVPVRLHFDSSPSGQPVDLDAAQDVAKILHSPVFSKANFGTDGETQYVDAMLRATTGTAGGWHTMLGQPEVRPVVTVEIPPEDGYVLTSKRTGTQMAIVNARYVQGAIFKQIPRQGGKLVIAVTQNTAFGSSSWGTHGLDEATGNSFVLASYLAKAPPQVEEYDIQPLTEQLAEWVNDPLHDPLFHVVRDYTLPPPYTRPQQPAPPGNEVPAWMRPDVSGAVQHGCGSRTARGTLDNPLDTNGHEDLGTGPNSTIRAGGSEWHVANVALMGWYTGGAGPYSFPDAQILQAAAQPCPARPSARRGMRQPAPPSPVAAVPSTGSKNGHMLIGNWTGQGPGGTFLRLRDVSPQWDLIIVAFSGNVDHQAPEGTQIEPGRGVDLPQLKEDIAYLHSRGKKVQYWMGGGSEYFTLANKSSIPNFVESVTKIVTEYGYDGVNLDYETPSLVLDPGDRDFRHPTTPSVVNLMVGLHQLRDHFGPSFTVSMTPEGPQIQGGYPTYGGQYGSYLPLYWGLRDMLSFICVQEYNTPPLEGLDGEIYQLGSVDYDVAMTELLLHGFNVDGRKADFFPPVPANKVAVGFEVSTSTPELVMGAMQYLITGKAPAGTTYKLLKPGGYPGMIGAKFWTLDADRNLNYSFSNQVGPQLHGFPGK